MRWLVAAMAVAAMLRVPYLSDRPMHADEAILADRAGTLVETGRFRYDPSEHHGPVLAYATWVAARLTGVSSYAAFSEALVRSVPLLFGFLLVAISYLLGRAVGGASGAAVAAMGVAVSPMFVYYSRFYIAEVPFVFGSAVLLWLLVRAAADSGMATSSRWRLGPGMSCVLGGITIGLLGATKETAVLVVAAALAAFRVRLRTAVLAAAIALLTTAGLYWQSGLPELPNAAAIYLQRGIDGGRHAHSSWYYFELLLKSGEIVWVMAGLAAARVAQARPLFVYAVVLTVCYSLLRYKTPWCALGFVHAWILLAAVAAAHYWRTPPFRIAVVAALALLGVQAWRLSVPLAAEPSNPWAYAQTTRDVYSIRDRVLEVAKGRDVHILTDGNWWPLPWYLRGQPNVHWWRQAPAALDGLVLVSPSLERSATEALYNREPGNGELYVPLFEKTLWLRPGVEVRGYAPLAWMP